MNFLALNPLFLVGLLAVALPVIAHLISRKKGAPRKFSAVALLLASDKETIRKSNPRDFALLALRALTIALIVLMFAKPATLTESAADIGDIQSAAVVIDNSFSMGYTDNFKRAKRRAEELIESLPDGGFLAIFPLVPSRGFKPEFSQDKRELRRDLDALTLSYSFADNEKRMLEIHSALEKYPAEDAKAVIFLTDSQQNGWRSGEVFQGDWFRAIDVGDGLTPENRAIGYFELKPSGDALVAEVAAANHSPNTAENLLLGVSAGDVELQGFISIGADAAESRKFTFTDKQHQGEIIAKAQITDDKLPSDDTRHYILPRNAEIRVLMIDGDPREDARLGETFYLAEALRTISEVRAMSLTARDNEALLDEKLDNYDFIILANVGDITPQKAREIKEFIERGGAMLIFAGERVRANVYNALLDGILPARFEEISEGEYSLSPDGSEAFSGEIRGKLSKVRVDRFFKLTPPPDARTMISVSDGSPFLVEKRSEDGRVFLFASTADRSWNEFPLGTAFVPVIKEILDLAHGFESGRRNFTVGDAVKIEFSGEVKRATVESPEGEEFTASRENPIFGEARSPGVYAVKFDGGGKYSFAVNVDPRESDLRKIELPKPAPKSAAEEGKTRTFKELWRYFLWGVISLVIAESVFRWVRR